MAYRLYSVKLENYEAQDTCRVLVSVPASHDEQQKAEGIARTMATPYRSRWALQYAEFVCETPDAVLRTV